MNVRVIKGCPRDEWARVQAIQDQPFIYIQYNGSHWAGESPDDIDQLVYMLETQMLEPWYRTRGPNYSSNASGYWNDDPCRGVENPDWRNSAENAPGVTRYIDGHRLYRVDGVTRFYGNFRTYSHAFCIDTNHGPTIARLKAAINANIERNQEAA